MLRKARHCTGMRPACCCSACASQSSPTLLKYSGSFSLELMPLSQRDPHLKMFTDCLAQGFGDRMAQVHRARQRRRLLQDVSGVVRHI